MPLNKLLVNLTDGTHYTPTYTETGIRFISVTNIAENEIDFINTKYISEKEHNEFIKRCNPEPNSILLTKIGSIGRAAVVPENCPPFSIFVSVALLKTNERIVPEYLCAYLNSRLALRQFERHLKGIGVPDLHLENIEQTQIILPELSIQVKLANLYIDAYSLYKKRLKKASRLFDEISNYIHSSLGIYRVSNVKPMIFATKNVNVIGTRIDTEYHNPFYTHRVEEIKKTNYDTLGNIIDFSIESWNQKDKFEGTFPYIEISGVKLKENSYEITEVPINDAPSRAKMIVRKGDIIVSTTRPHRGAIATINCADEDIQIASTGFCVLRKLKRNDVLKEYLQWILLDDYVLLQMLQRSSGGNYPAITSEELKKIVVPIPDISIQKEICAEATKRKSEADKLRNEAECEWQAAKEQFEKDLLGD